ncbi:MAG: hypothetical protein LBM60_07540 [Clostridium sp.]|jgi:hypothetical protein|nr:hypothetical protein [Clostridium sp.]
MLRPILKDKHLLPYGIAFTLLLMLSVICVIRMLLPNKVFSYDASDLSVDGSMGGISLSPGVYRVELIYQTNEDQKILCTLSDGSVFSGGLLTNGESLYSGKGKTEFLAWLFESTDTLEIHVQNVNNIALETNTLTFYETNQLWSMYLTILLFCQAMLCGILYYRYRSITHGIDRRQKNIFFGLVVIVLLASLPYLLGVSLSGADLTYHLHRIYGVAQGLLSGQFPVRIYPHWPNDFGYADGVMYGNALLLFPALLRLLGFTVTSSYNIFGIAMNIATAWIAYACFARIFKNYVVGLLCSALYTLSIFRIYKLVITSALGEGSALIFMPLILLGFYQIFTLDSKSSSPRNVWIPLTIGFAGILQTHVLTLEITALLTVVTCLVFVRKIWSKQIFWLLVKGAAGAVTISLWFIVPFLDYYLHENLHIRFVSARTIQDRGLYIPQLAFHWWKLGNNASLNDMGMQYSHALGVGMVLVLGFIVFGVLWYSGKWKQNIIAGPTIKMGKYLFLLGGILMLFSLNIFPWDQIQKLGTVPAALVSSLQFPNRFLGWGTLCLVVVFGCCLNYFQKQNQRWYYYIGVICVFIAITTSSMYLLDHVNQNHNRYILYNEEGMGMGYVSGAEYLVEGTDNSLLVYKAPETSGNVALMYYEKNNRQVRFNCQNESNEEGYVELPLLLYTGYKAHDLNENLEFPVIDGTNHTVCVVIPPNYTGTVRVAFVPPFHWRMSEIISYAGWLGILIFGFMRSPLRNKILKVVKHGKST